VVLHYGSATPVRLPDEQALDEVGAAASRKMAQEGYSPLLKKSGWCVRKRSFRLRLLSGE